LSRKSTKNKVLSAFLIFFLFVALVTVASAAKETQLTHGARLTDSTAIYGNNVFWTETTANDLHAYNLTTGKEIDINGNYAVGKINSYGNKTVWTGDDGDAVYMYDISSGNETKVSSEGRLPDIYKNYIVYTNNYYSQDCKNNGIYLYDLNTNNQTRIATVYGYPVIYGTKVVWSQANSSGSDICMYDICTHQTSTITTTNSSIPESELDISGNIIVWIEAGNVYMYDIATHKKTQVTSSGNVSQPVIYGKRIVYGAGDLYSGNIYIYDISTAKKIRITTSTEAFSPSIYGDKIIYADLRNPENPDVRDIYLYELKPETEKLKAIFNANIISCKVPLEVKFTDKSTGSPTFWSWNFGDKSTSTAQNPTHKYTKKGTYSVSLTVKNTAGSNSITKSYITVK
jgi:FOG: PKD repeat